MGDTGSENLQCDGLKIAFETGDENYRSLIEKLKSVFGDALIVNAKGEVVGVLVGGGEIGGKNYVTATHIKEIQKIKF